MSFVRLFVLVALVIVGVASAALLLAAPATAAPARPSGSYFLTATPRATPTRAATRKPTRTPTRTPVRAPTATITPTPLPPVTPLAEGTGDQALLEAGRAVYLKQYCGVCHTLAAAGTKGAFGPSHEQIGTNAAARIQMATYNGQATDAAGYLRESIVEPRAFLAPGSSPNHPMPAYTNLTAEEVDALVYFLLQQK
jgi:mono/diheme cytochrome c family protein